MITRVIRTDSHDTAAYPRLGRGHAVPAAMPGSDESKRAKPASPGFGSSVAYDGLHDVRDGLRSVAYDGLVVIAAAYVTVGLFRAVADFMRRRRDD